MRTQRIYGKGIKVYENSNTPGPKKCSVKITRRHTPSYSIRKKLYTSFHVKNLKGIDNPGPSDYNINLTQVETTKNQGNKIPDGL
jgi:hypothetical protein